jgi:hypothetical protein
LLLTLLAASAVFAHHGWRWTADGNVELTGVIKVVRLGNPHGRVTLQVEQEQWLVEVGQPWRNESAGVTDEMLSPGTEITAIGQRSADPDERRLKAERLRIGGREYVLYPDRD